MNPLNKRREKKWRKKEIVLITVERELEGEGGEEYLNAFKVPWN